MSLNGGYTLNRNGRTKVEACACAWAAKWKNCFASITNHAAVEAAYDAARKARTSMMPNWLDSDEDFAEYDSQCDLWFNLEKACDDAHERIEPSYFA